ncbi:NAD(P)-binding protein [Gonapodya prolifera JEL478]|uniref:NAD(P)-binding protein n=1 Tax=Gonapodya prolifera (strain JEL478) TaxID=1344416 RepID=A0A139AGX6_GONPJ|nr:NAD(P)-binding protein [Gonapodya prolifera JEL478]|eukprot:KXS15998.1 NAD(P)-binding protein [Gonapodya prolifera JEL478]
MGRLDGKVCIATGAGNEFGIGFASALKFAADGAKAVVITCRPGADKLKAAVELAEKIRAQHPATETLALEAEAASESDTKKVIDEAVKRWGRLDVLFANAGWGGTNLDRTPITDISEEDFMYTLRTNVLHPFFCIKHGCPAMQALGGSKSAPGGSIVINGSTAGVPLLAGRISADYVASKAAANSLAETASYQLASYRVRINTLAPGYIQTSMTSGNVDAIQFTSKAPGVGRTGHPEEMANVVAFLASDEASYVNGATWVANGGVDSALAMYIKQTPDLPPRHRLE